LAEEVTETCGGGLFARARIFIEYDIIEALVGLLGFAPSPQLRHLPRSTFFMIPFLFCSQTFQRRNGNLALALKNKPRAL
jgi:hypothetical protein